MRKIWIKFNDSLMPFIDIIEQTKDNIDFVNNSNNDFENLDALTFNIKNSLAAIKQDVIYINKDTLRNYVQAIKKSKELIDFIMNKSINNIESIIASLPKDDYDSMSKEELIALLREQNSK